jgi:hypothetical protein
VWRLDELEKIGVMATQPKWLTWPHAAELIDCAVSTVETYVRSGRIERRPGQGRRDGSLRRESVEEFAAWWRDEAARRDQRRAERLARDGRRIKPPEPEGWILAKDAAEQLGYAHSDHVVWLSRQGKLEARKVGVRWWVREAEVRKYAQEREQWVSHVRAGEIVGCSAETIRRAVKAGLIQKRDVHRTQASLSRDSVLDFARRRELQRPLPN